MLNENQKIGTITKKKSMKEDSVKDKQEEDFKRMKKKMWTLPILKKSCARKNKIEIMITILKRLVSLTETKKLKIMKKNNIKIHLKFRKGY